MDVALTKARETTVEDKIIMIMGKAGLLTLSFPANNGNKSEVTIKIACLK